MWACEELGIAYELSDVNFMDKAFMAEYTKSVHPLGLVPAARLPRGDILLDSVAILQEICEDLGNGTLVAPVSHPDRSKYLQWMQLGETIFAVAFGPVAQNEFLMPEKLRVPELAKRGRRNLPAAMALVEKALESGAPFLLPEFGFSAADITTGYSLHAAASMLGEFDAARYPLTTAYVERLRAREAFQRAF